VGVGILSPETCKIPSVGYVLEPRQMYLELGLRPCTSSINHVSDNLQVILVSKDQGTGRNIENTYFRRVPEIQSFSFRKRIDLYFDSETLPKILKDLKVAHVSIFGENDVSLAWRGWRTYCTS
jgi:hypothetical protein